MINRERVYIDMDGVLVNLESEINLWFGNHPHLKERYKDCPDEIPGLFRNPYPLEGAVDAIKQLSECGKYELVIATAAPWGNPEAAMDKRYWIERYFGPLFKKQMVITHRKNLLIGDYLIDDKLSNGAADFDGTLLRFGWNYETKVWNEYRTWKHILKELL